MIIVSQDKKSVVNSRIMNIIEIFNYGTKSGLRAENRDDTYVLAIYDTEERAKEVLQEIVRLYRRCQQVVGERGGIANFIYPPKVYEMPKE